MAWHLQRMIHLVVKLGYEIGGLLTNLIFKLPYEQGLCIWEGTQVLPVT